MGRKSRAKWDKRAREFRKNVDSKTPAGDERAVEILAGMNRPEKLIAAVDRQVACG